MCCKESFAHVLDSNYYEYWVPRATSKSPMAFLVLSQQIFFPITFSSSRTNSPNLPFYYRVCLSLYRLSSDGCDYDVYLLLQ